MLADAADAKKLANTLLKVLKDVTDPLVVKYALTHIEDILTTDLHKVRDDIELLLSYRTMVLSSRVQAGGGELGRHVRISSFSHRPSQ